ncbi:MAG: response regulator transcription factor [Pseudomonadota bacterium]
MARFLIIDDHPLFGEALGNAIRISRPEAKIFETTSISEAMEVLAVEPGIDLALLDLLLPEVVGFSGFLRLRERYPKLPIAIVSSNEDKQTIREALDMGAAGYLPKSTSITELSHAIERLLNGLVTAPREFAATGPRDRADATRTLKERMEELTPQQVRVLQLITRGLQNREIAVELKLAESTVKAHVTEILRKLKLFSRNKAIIEVGKISMSSTGAGTNPRTNRESST